MKEKLLITLIGPDFTHRLGSDVQMDSTVFNQLVCLCSPGLLDHLTNAPNSNRRQPAPSEEACAA